MISTTIADYKVTAKLGQGGMGVVYRAERADYGDGVDSKHCVVRVVSNFFTELNENAPAGKE